MSSKNALVVDDDEDVAGFVTMAIESLGYAVSTAGTGADALAALAASVPDLVILDMHLPDMLGVDILTHMRADDRLNRVRVVVLSAGTQPLHWNLQSRADLVLTKPIDAATLIRLVARLEMRAA